jgi:isoleucyl-tRNA synthetase
LAAYRGGFIYFKKYMAEQIRKHPLVVAEEETQKFWEDNKIFEKSVDKEAPHGDYKFYDGPPFATGTPHYGHLVGSAMKDAVPRFWTMRGYKVARRWGWDCHGLPIENIVEKELGFKHKKDIEEYGVEKFNEMCRTKVLEFADIWRQIIPRFGRWADMDNAYSTMSRDYMESVWSVFKLLWDKGLIYEGYKTMHVCPRCETTLSQQEVSEGYKMIKDWSVTVTVELVDEPGTYVLAWTTTPWTLPGNVALAVNKDVDYVKVVHNNEKYILARSATAKLFPEQGEAQSLESFAVENLIGKSYKPLFDYFTNNTELKNHANGWKVFHADLIEIVTF